MVVSRFHIAVIIVFYSLTFFSFAQVDDSRDKSVFYDYGRRFFSEAHILPTRSSDTIKADVLFRTANSLLTFKKFGLSKGEYYFAIPSVEIEIRDSLGVIRKRITWTDTIQVDSYYDTKSKNSYHYGSAIAALPSAAYRVNVSLVDLNIGRTLQSRSMILSRASISSTNNTILQPIFGEYDQETPTLIKPFVLDSGISFESKDPRIFVLTTYKGSEPAAINYKCSNSPNQRPGTLNWQLPLFISGSVSPEENTTIDISQVSKNDMVFFNKEPIIPTDTDNKIALAEISIPADKMSPGLYDLYLWTQNGDTLFKRFRIDWENMPLSFKDPEYASKMMYYILTDEEFDNLTDGSQVDVFNNVLTYWKKHDPTPHTMYNEAMNEYFQRVDYAFFNFQTISEKDGAKTDRGKIYILFGNPTKTERNLQEGQTREIWRYENLKKEYIFETVSNGTYKLKTINEI